MLNAMLTLAQAGSDQSAADQTAPPPDQEASSQDASADAGADAADQAAAAVNDAMHSATDALQSLPDLVAQWLPPWAQTPVFGAPLVNWAVAVVVFLVAFIVLRTIVAIVRARIGVVSRRMPQVVGESLERMAKKVSFIALFAVSLYLASLPLGLSGTAQRVLGYFVVIGLALQAAIWAGQLVEVGITALLRSRSDEGADDSTLRTSVGIMKWAALAVVYGIILLLALENLGVDVTAMIAGLGIGGIAIALAAQKVLGDLFSSLSIVLDKPFVVGDFIVVGTEAGTVENVGLKTTRVRSISGEQLVFTNSDLLAARIRNFKRMQERRILFSFGVLYQTSADALERVPGIVKEIVEQTKNTRFDRCHFNKFGDSSLDFETVYFVSAPDYNTYMNAQQAINLALFRRFEEEGIDFAYPTRTLYIEKGGFDAKAPADREPASAKG